jgi:hypothetical protein
MQNRTVPAISLALLATMGPAGASANTEPTTYDTRSLTLAQAGVSFLERPAAIAINPALLTGIDAVAGMPAYWTLLEGPTTVILGVVILLLVRRVEPA